VHPAPAGGEVRVATVDAVADALRRRLGRTVEPDDWVPAVQGAVGHVVGIRVDGVGHVAKLFGPGADDRAATEVRALRLAGGVGGLPVPEVVGTAPLPGGSGSVVLLTRLPGARWADRRDALDVRQGDRLVRDAAAALRRAHGVPGDSFGALVGAVGPCRPRASGPVHVWTPACGSTSRAAARRRSPGGSGRCCTGTRTSSARACDRCCATTT